MKFLRQFGIILLLSALGEALHELLPLPVPASVYGLVLMLAALMTGIIKVGQVEETADFLIEIMPVMFIPAGVGLMSSWNVLQPVLLPVSVITVLTIFTVMAATGLVSQVIIRNKKKEKLK